MRRTIAACVGLLLGLAGCAAGSNLAGSGPAASLNIDVDPGDGAVMIATLTCGDAGASGTGWLSEQGAAKDACGVVEGNAPRLISGASDDGVCTLEYGGPQTARVTGTVDGHTVDTGFHRTDGCGIGDWDTFVPLLGEPGGVQTLE